MAGPRKIFRIEETAAARLGRNGDGAPDSVRHGEIIEALSALRALIGPASSPEQFDPISGQAVERHAARQAEHWHRVAHELEAVTTGTAQATQKILTAAEEIDQLANNLDAALNGKIEQGLTQDISDLVIQIFEACNFQDLTGQRVAKVMKALQSVEDDAGSAVRRGNDAGHYLHGPRLEIDSGHITQREIDALFGG